jgi:hypothetical protein
MIHTFTGQHREKQTPTPTAGFEFVTLVFRGEAGLGSSGIDFGHHFTNTSLNSFSSKSIKVDIGQRIESNAPCLSGNFSDTLLSHIV